MLITKETEEAKDKHFATRDISRRAKLAVEQNVRLFNSPQHKEVVEQVNVIVSKMFAHIDAVYETARPATKKFPAHTEVKFSNVVLFGRDKHTEVKRQVIKELSAFNLDLIYKPNTNSYSVKVK